MKWPYPDPGERKGADLAAYRVGNTLALLLISAVAGIIGFGLAQIF